VVEPRLLEVLKIFENSLNYVYCIAVDNRDFACGPLLVCCQHSDKLYFSTS
jgi:hypothetical protein